MIKLFSCEGVGAHLREHVKDENLNELINFTIKLIHLNEEIKFCNSCNLAGAFVEIYPELMPKYKQIIPRLITMVKD